MDVWGYFESKRREVEGFGLTLDDGFLMAAEARSGDQRGRVWGRINVTERTFLQVSERVEVHGSGIHRTDYAYYLITDGVEVWGYERDPSHAGQEVHCHDRFHRRSTCGAVSFKQALEWAWDTASDEDMWIASEDALLPHRSQ